LEISPLSAEIYSNRGVSYSKKGDYDLAIADFTRAMKLNPNAAIAYYNRGMTYAAKGNVNNALFDLEKCLELDPSNAAAYDARGSLLADLACSEWEIACKFGNCKHIREAVKIGLCDETTNNPLATKF
jgi:tetratricopeptide (TPR) repeat protein